jgi:hypothetical protein
VVHAVGFRNLPTAFAGSQSLPGFLHLVPIELRFASEPGAALPGGRPPIVGSPYNPLPLLFGKPRQESKNTPTRRGSEIKAWPIENLDQPSRLWTLFMISMPSIRLRVARSHSASTSTPLVASASMALASSSRFLTSRPDAFSR